MEETTGVSPVPELSASQDTQTVTQVGVVEGASSWPPDCYATVGKRITGSKYPTIFAIEVDCV